MKKSIIKTISITALSIILFIYGAVNAFSATDQAEIKLLLDKESFIDSDYFYLYVSIESEINSYKASQISLDYSDDVLEIKEIKLNDDACDLFGTNFQSKGKADILCFSSSTNEQEEQIARIKINKKQTGLGEIRLNRSVIMSNEASPQNIFTETEIFKILIK
ncbi:hypothetical protein C0583_04815 [Candidatus Parcubacteria bacterium]|nr:MAG: hypothetical protein C0583_04815 [Candidatus Parcubacteria bacterium]